MNTLHLVKVEYVPTEEDQQCLIAANYFGVDL